ncbi:MAG TPA: hypothetical protein VFC80_00985 [Sphaerochaeta sp.]|nr:hypothetical protein [Sphaerochaeta sp.]
MSYRFTRVNLVQSEGFDRPPFDPILTFGPGLNIITGPNGVGKSTLLRVMRSLLHGTEISARVHADATVHSDTQEWELSLSQGELTQRKAGDKDLSSLPGRNAEFSESYFFALHELLDSVYDTPIFLEQIRKELHGGINLKIAAEQSGARGSFSSANIALARAVEEARKAVTTRQDQIDKHADIMETIASLEKKIATEGTIREEIERYTKAVFAKKTQEKHVQLTDTLAAFDTRVTQIHRGSEEEYTSLLSRVEKAKEEVAAQLHLITEKEQEIASLQVAAEYSGDAAWRMHLTELIDQLSERELERQRCEREYREANATYKAVKRELAWLLPEVPSGGLLQSALTQLTELASESERVRLDVAVTRRLLTLLGEPIEGSEAALEQVAKELDAVATALSEQGHKSGASQTRIVAALAAVLVGGVGSLWWPPLGLTVTAIVALVLFLLRGRQSGVSIERTIASLGEREGISGDASTLPVKLYRLLSERQARLQSGLERNKEINRTRQELQKKEAAYQSWRTDYHEAAQALHLRDHPALEQAAFFTFSSTLLRLLQTAEAVEAKQKLYQSADAAYTHAAEALIAHASLSFGTYHALLRSARQLLEQIVDYEGLVQDLTRYQRELQQLQKRLSAAEAERDAFYAKIGLAVGDDRGFWLLVEALPRYTKGKEEQETLQRDLDRIDSEALALADTQTKEALERALTERNEELDAVLASHRTLANLESAYDELIHSDELAILDRRWRMSLAELEEHRKEAVEARMIAALVAEIQEESQRKHQPEVVRNASSWLERITHNRYTLLASDDFFTVKDAVTGRTQQIDELSSGTRVQLLFSIRMGFLESHEQDRMEHFPLFFDEILANSDDLRSLAIAEAIAEVATTRQIFYATAQADEVSKLQQVITDAKVFDLGELSGKRATAARPFTPVSYQVAPVPTAIEDYEQYAQTLSVSAPALFHPIGEVHPWYLCINSAELYELLNQNLATAAQARRKGPLYERRFNLLALAQRFARQGRPRQLSSAALYGSPEEVNRTTQYWQQIIDFLDAEVRTGNDLVTAIENKEIQRLQDPARATLLLWLAEEGYSNDALPLSGAEILVEIAIADPAFTVESIEYGIVLRYLTALGLGTI